MRIIVAGGGRVGAQLATTLAGAGNEVVVVEADPARVAGLRARGAPGGGAAPGGAPGGGAATGTPLRVVDGNACVAEVLEAAGALRADVLVACTQSDEENLVISVLAKRHLEVPVVVARLNDEANRWLFGPAWGVDVAVSEASALASLIAESRWPAADGG